MNRCFLVKGWLLVSVALAAGDVLYSSRSSSQRIARVLRMPLPPSSFLRPAEKRQSSRTRQLDELIDSSKIALGLENAKGRHLSAKGHSPHSYGQYFSGKSGKGKSKGKGSSKSKKSEKKEKKEKTTTMTCRRFVRSLTSGPTTLMSHQTTTRCTRGTRGRRVKARGLVGASSNSKVLVVT
jgi:hypothetical protein